MSSIVLELQHELLQKDCDVMQALRKAHIIAVKLNLSEFDEWVQSELYGYKKDFDSLPVYRQMRGELKAKNPYRGWIPAVITDSKNGQPLNTVPMYESLSALIDINQKSVDGYFYYSYPPELSMRLCNQSNAPTYMEFAVFISTYHITEAVEQVRNCLLEWTLKLEGKGIKGENMIFDEKESASAKEIPQQINNYYGTVVQGIVSSSQIVSGSNITATYNAAEATNAVQEIRESLGKESISSEDMDSALELLEDISSKLEQNKKSSIVKAAFVGLKDFLLATGANVTATLITAKMQGLF